MSYEPRFTVEVSSPRLWRVRFLNPPINAIDAPLALQLHELLDQIEQDPEVAVLLFESQDEEFCPSLHRDRGRTGGLLQPQ